MKRLIPVTLAIAVVCACSSNPSIPDDDKARDYKSTTHDDQKPVENKTALEQPKETGYPKAVGPVATIDGKPVEASEYNKEMERIAATGMMSAAQVSAVKVQLVDRIVDQKLLENAVTKSGIKVGQEDVDKKIKEVEEQYAALGAPNGQNSLAALTKQLGITEKEFRDSIRQTIALEAVLAKRGLKDPPKADVKKLYDDNIETFTQPEQVRASHILLKVAPDADEKTWASTGKKAKELTKLARTKNADFAALAKEHSQDLSAEKGGDLGFFPRNAMVKEFEDAAFKLKKNAVSDPIRSQFGWHVIKAVDRKEGGPVPFAEVEDSLKARLKQAETQKMLATFLEELRGAHKIEIFENNIR